MPHMQDDFPLLLSTLYQQAVDLYPDQTIVSVEHDKQKTRTSYADTDDRVRRLATAVNQLGVEQGDAVGTFAWNNQRHHELYWALANTGWIVHTLNIRLFAEQLSYIVNHAQDRVIFVDPDLVPVLAQIVDTFETVEHYVIMGPDADDRIPGSLAYEELISDAKPWADWPRIDERSPMMLCYTSGTTGRPKGVAYTQRSTYMHTLSNLVNFPIDPRDAVLPVVPMFHAAAWGYPFKAVTKGARLVYPGPDLTPSGLTELISSEQVTIAVGVPTVWIGIQHHLQANPDADISSVRAIFCGGSAVPRGMIDWFMKERDIVVQQGWGMTETNPVASVALLKPASDHLDWDDKLDHLETAGLPIPGLEVKIVDEAGDELPRDGIAFGELLIRGPWVASEYYRDDRTKESFQEGWLRTGDVCTIDPEGYIRITDRAKDLIKSGGEWISSVELENHLMAHPDVVEATVVGLKHERWVERPVAFVVTAKDVTEGELLTFLSDKVAKWWLPDQITFTDEIPKTGTGKFDKKVVRDRYSDLLLG